MSQPLHAKTFDIVKNPFYHSTILKDAFIEAPTGMQMEVMDVLD